MSMTARTADDSMNSDFFMMYFLNEDGDEYVYGSYKKDDNGMVGAINDAKDYGIDVPNIHFVHTPLPVHRQLHLLGILIP